MEHGVRIELRELAPQPHRGSESAAQLIAADRPLWRADLFFRPTDVPGRFCAAHYHPEVSRNEPRPRTLYPELTAHTWRWVRGQVAQPCAGAGGEAWQPEPADAGELSGLADTVVTLARELAPDRCRSARECFQLTRDARASVRLMIEYLRRPDLLDEAWVSAWAGTA